MVRKSAQGLAELPIEKISQSILLIRGQKVMLDTDLAQLYGVTTKRLNEQVKRNIDRFPPDFMFQLNSQEKQEVVANCDHLRNLKFSPALPRAYTEHGALMAASMLNTARAVEISVFVVRAFIQLRELLTSNKALAKKFEELERKLSTHDQAITEIVKTIRQLMAPDPSNKRSIGFAPWPKEH